MTDIVSIVHKAALYLDEHYPGWADKLRGVNYDISYCDNCILKHVAGSYSVGLEAYKSRVSSDNWLNGNFPFCAIGLNKIATHAAWDAEIAKRLRPASIPVPCTVGGVKMLDRERELVTV
jgi:hypothetical protein